MKQLLIVLGILVLLTATGLAGPDLTVQEFKLKGDTIEATGSYPYQLYVKNIGDEAAKTRLPIIKYSAIESPPSLAVPPYPLVSDLVDQRNNKGNFPVTILSPDGDKKVFPEQDTVEYLAPALSEGELLRELDTLKGHLEAAGTSEEEIGAELAKTKEELSQPHHQTVSGWFVTIKPGEVAIFDSEVTVSQSDKIAFTWKPPLSLESIPVKYYVQIDPKGEADSNLENNKYETTIELRQTVVKGPLPASAKNKELKDVNEYFAFGFGCGDIGGKKICVELDEKTDNFSVEVDGVKQEYSLYNLFMNWLSKAFSDGKLAGMKNVNGVEVTLYDTGFKFKVGG
ncbi:hypothetical protein HZC30_06480 [Candidatus Woesearchaeota archaeon]|nr:hypothetical protein [Candidatus Woesearchaeota archaeon]